MMKDRIAEGNRPDPAYRERVPDHRPAAAGYHQATISAVERTERIPGIDVLLDVGRALAGCQFSDGIGPSIFGREDAEEGLGGEGGGRDFALWRLTEKRSGLTGGPSLGGKDTDRGAGQP